MKVGSLVSGLALLFCASEVAAVNNFNWDSTIDPESTNNMCYAIYCLGKAQTLYVSYPRSL